MNSTAKRKTTQFRATPVPNLAGKRPDDTITRKELVALIAASVPRMGRNNISAKVSYHVKFGKLPKAGPGLFKLGAIADWAPKAWPRGQFRNVPRYPPAMLPARVSGTGFALPPTLGAAIEQILSLRAENAALRQRLASAGDQVRDLEPDAKKWRAWNNKKRESRPAKK